MLSPACTVSCEDDVHMGFQAGFQPALFHAAPQRAPVVRSHRKKCVRASAHKARKKLTKEACSQSTTCPIAGAKACAKEALAHTKLITVTAFILLESSKEPLDGKIKKTAKP